MFSFIYNQFSKPSKYDISVNFDLGESFNIDFSLCKIENLLPDINSSKAMGPDGIHGKMLKNCSKGLAGPLSKLFQICYYNFKLPGDWKSAHVVPVHKKGYKTDVKNYRPIKQ